MCRLIGSKDQKMVVSILIELGVFDGTKVGSLEKGENAIDFGWIKKITG